MKRFKENADDYKATVYVGTYGKYNDGNLDGAWLAPAEYDTYEDFMDACYELHSDEEDPELMFQDVSGIPDRLYSESSFSEELFNYCKAIEEFGSYEELLMKYGYDYLAEHDPDSTYYEMEMLQEMFEGETFEYVLQRAFFGYDAWYDEEGNEVSRETFNPNREYFTFNGYGNLVSLSEGNLMRYLNAYIEEEDFIQWCMDEGYIG